jgi:hypothetical protein
VISSPVAWDLDLDGAKEILVGSWDGYFYVLDSNLGNRSGWPQFSRGGFFSSPALSDLDGDGTTEIVVGSDAGRLYAWHSSGEPVRGFPADLGCQLWSSPTILKDGSIAIGGCEKMYVLGRDGLPADGWPRSMQGWADATAAYASGLLAITSLTPGDPSHGWIHVWCENGHPLPRFPIELPLDSDSSPAWGEFDGDGQLWLVFGDDAGWLHVFSTAGEERSGFPVRTQGVRAGPTPTPHPPGGNIHSIEASPALGDLDSDGRLEIVVGSWDGRMYVWDDTGHSLAGWPIEVGDQIISSAALADVDGDDFLDIVVGSKDGCLYGWTAQGETLPGFPYQLGGPIFSSPWIGDIEGDGLFDIVVGASNGIHLLMGVGSGDRMAWPMFHQNETHQGMAR